MSKKGGDSQTTTQKVEPWQTLQPYLKGALRDTQDQYKEGGSSYYPNSTVVDMSGQTIDALQMQEERARNGSVINNLSSEEIQKTLSGEYLNDNPYLQTMLDNQYKEINGLNSSKFASSNAYGSSAMQQTNQRDQMAMANEVLFNNYNSERDRMMQASQIAPQIAQQDYADIAQLGAVGQAYDQQGGLELQDDIDRFYYDQNQEKINLDEYINRLNTIGGQYVSQSTSQPTAKTGILDYALPIAGLALDGGTGGFGSSLLGTLMKGN